MKMIFFCKFYDADGKFWNFTTSFKITLLVSQIREPYEIAVICDPFAFKSACV